MIYLPSETKNILQKSIRETFDSSGLTEFFNTISKVLKEDAEQIDFNSLNSRCQWLLSKIVKGRDNIIKLTQSEDFTSMFKDLQFTTNDKELVVTYAGNEVSGSTKFLLTTLVIIAYMLNLSLKSLPSYNKVGGLLIFYTSRTLVLELYKKSFLSRFGINGEVIRDVFNSTLETDPLSILVASLLGLLLIANDFDKVFQTTTLLLISVIKSSIDKSIGFLYTFLVKSSELLHLDLALVAKDVYKQLLLARGE